MAWHVCFVLVYKHLQCHTCVFLSSSFMSLKDGGPVNVHEWYEQYLVLLEAVEATCQGTLGWLAMFVLLSPTICIVLALKVSYFALIDRYIL